MSGAWPRKRSRSCAPPTRRISTTLSAASWPSIAWTCVAATSCSSPTWWSFEPDSSINTNPLLVHAAYEAFRAAGAASVRIAEGPGHRRNTLDLADAAGYFQVVPDFERVFVDLNLDEVTRVAFERQFSRLQSLYLPRTVSRRRPARLHAQDEKRTTGSGPR